MTQLKIERIPETNEEIAEEMINEGMVEFKSQVIFLQSVLQRKQWHNIKLTDEDVQKYIPIFKNYLTSKMEAQ
jgi:hypothetical protein